jgi:hypothetical protein
MVQSWLPEDASGQAAGFRISLDEYLGIVLSGGGSSYNPEPEELREFAAGLREVADYADELADNPPDWAYALKKSDEEELAWKQQLEQWQGKRPPDMLASAGKGFRVQAVIRNGGLWLFTPHPDPESAATILSKERVPELVEQLEALVDFIKRSVEFLSHAPQLRCSLQEHPPSKYLTIHHEDEQ